MPSFRLPLSHDRLPKDLIQSSMPPTSIVGCLALPVLPSDSHLVSDVPFFPPFPSSHQGPALLLEHLCVSLPSCRSWVALDSKLCPLPFSPALSQHSKQEDTEVRGDDMGLEELKDSLKDTQPVGPLVGLAVTLDQVPASFGFQICSKHFSLFK